MNQMAITHQRWMRSPRMKAWCYRTRTIQVLADLVCGWAAADETTIYLDVVAFRNVQPLDARTTVLADKRIMEVPTTSPSPSTRLISHAKASSAVGLVVRRTESPRRERTQREKRTLTTPPFAWRS